jgi:hypothetical protein
VRQVAEVDRITGTTARERLAARHGMSVEQVAATTDEVLDEVVVDRTPDTDALDEQPRPLDAGEVAAPVVTVEGLVTETMRQGYGTVAAYLAAPGRDLGQVVPWLLDRAERALRAEVARLARVERDRATVPAAAPRVEVTATVPDLDALRQAVRAAEGDLVAAREYEQRAKAGDDKREAHLSSRRRRAAGRRLARAQAALDAATAAG